jgi:Vacuolar-sorting associated protein 13, adaptor binding domain
MSAVAAALSQFMWKNALKDLQEVLQDFFVDLKPVTSNTWWQGLAHEFNDIRLKPDFLHALSIPLQLDEGIIKHVETNLDMATLFSRRKLNLEVTLRGITLRVSPSRPTSTARLREKYKKLQLVIAEFFINKINTRSRTGLYDMFLRTNVRIEDLNIIYEDTFEHFAMHLSCKSIQTAHNREKVETDADRGIQRAAFDIEGLEVHMTSVVEDGMVEQEHKTQVLKPMSLSLHISTAYEAVEDPANANDNTESDNKHAFHQDTIKRSQALRASTLDGLGIEDTNTVGYTVEINLHDMLDVTILKDTVGNVSSMITKLMDRLFDETRNQTQQSLEVLRTHPVEGHGGDYWQLALRKVLPEVIMKLAKSRNLPMTPEWAQVYGLMSSPDNKERYIDLYKRNLNIVGDRPITNTEETERRQIEEQHAADTLMLWRTEALVRLGMERPDVKNHVERTEFDELQNGVWGAVFQAYPDVDEPRQLTTEEKRVAYRKALSYHVRSLRKKVLRGAYFTVNSNSFPFGLVKFRRLDRDEPDLRLEIDQLGINIDYTPQHTLFEVECEGFREDGKENEPRRFFKQGHGEMHLFSKFVNNSPENKVEQNMLSFFFRYVDIVSVHSFVSYFTDFFKEPFRVYQQKFLRRRNTAAESGAKMNDFAIDVTVSDSVFVVPFKTPRNPDRSAPKSSTDIVIKAGDPFELLPPAPPNADVVFSMLLHPHSDAMKLDLKINNVQSIWRMYDQDHNEIFSELIVESLQDWHISATVRRLHEPGTSQYRHQAKLTGPDGASDYIDPTQQTGASDDFDWSFLNSLEEVRLSTKLGTGDLKISPRVLSQLLRIIGIRLRRKQKQSKLRVMYEERFAERVRRQMLQEGQEMPFAFHSKVEAINVRHATTVKGRAVSELMPDYDPAMDQDAFIMSLQGITVNTQEFRKVKQRTTSERSMNKMIRRMLRDVVNHLLDGFVSSHMTINTLGSAPEIAQMLGHRTTIPMAPIIERARDAVQSASWSGAEARSFNMRVQNFEAIDVERSSGFRRRGVVIQRAVASIPQQLSQALIDAFDVNHLMLTIVDVDENLISLNQRSYEDRAFADFLSLDVTNWVSVEDIDASPDAKFSVIPGADAFNINLPHFPDMSASHWVFSTERVSVRYAVSKHAFFSLLVKNFEAALPRIEDVTDPNVQLDAISTTFDSRLLEHMLYIVAHRHESVFATQSSGVTLALGIELLHLMHSYSLHFRDDRALFAYMMTTVVDDLSWQHVSRDGDLNHYECNFDVSSTLPYTYFTDVRYKQKFSMFARGHTNLHVTKLRKLRKDAKREHDDNGNAGTVDPGFVAVGQIRNLELFHVAPPEWHPDVDDAEEIVDDANVADQDAGAGSTDAANNEFNPADDEKLMTRRINLPELPRHYPLPNSTIRDKHGTVIWTNISQVLYPSTFDLDYSSRPSGLHEHTTKEQMRRMRKLPGLFSSIKLKAAHPIKVNVTTRDAYFILLQYHKFMDSMNERRQEEKQLVQDAKLQNPNLENEFVSGYSAMRNRSSGTGFVITNEFDFTLDAASFSVTFLDEQSDQKARHPVITFLMADVNVDSSFFGSRLLIESTATVSASYSIRPDKKARANEAQVGTLLLPCAAQVQFSRDKPADDSNTSSHRMSFMVPDEMRILFTEPFWMDTVQRLKGYLWTHRAIKEWHKVLRGGDESKLNQSEQDRVRLIQNSTGSTIWYGMQPDKITHILPHGEETAVRFPTLAQGADPDHPYRVYISLEGDWEPYAVADLLGGFESRVQMTSSLGPGLDRARQKFVDMLLSCKLVGPTKPLTLAIHSTAVVHNNTDEDLDVLDMCIPARQSVWLPALAMAAGTFAVRRSPAFTWSKTFSIDDVCDEPDEPDGSRVQNHLAVCAHKGTAFTWSYHVRVTESAERGVFDIEINAPVVIVNHLPCPVIASITREIVPKVQYLDNQDDSTDFDSYSDHRLQDPNEPFSANVHEHMEHNEIAPHSSWDVLRGNAASDASLVLRLVGTSTVRVDGFRCGTRAPLIRHKWSSEEFPRIRRFVFEDAATHRQLQVFLYNTTSDARLRGIHARYQLFAHYIFVDRTSLQLRFGEDERTYMTSHQPRLTTATMQMLQQTPAAETLGDTGAAADVENAQVKPPLFETADEATMRDSSTNLNLFAQIPFSSSFVEPGHRRVYVSSPYCNSWSPAVLFTPRFDQLPVVADKPDTAFSEDTSLAGALRKLMFEFEDNIEKKLFSDNDKKDSTEEQKRHPPTLDDLHLADDKRSRYQIIRVPTSLHYGTSDDSFVGKEAAALLDKFCCEIVAEVRPLIDGHDIDQVLDGDIAGGRGGTVGALSASTTSTLLEKNEANDSQPVLARPISQAEDGGPGGASTVDVVSSGSENGIDTHVDSKSSTASSSGTAIADPNTKQRILTVPLQIIFTPRVKIVNQLECSIAVRRTKQSFASPVDFELPVFIPSGQASPLHFFNDMPGSHEHPAPLKLDTLSFLPWFAMPQDQYKVHANGCEHVPWEWSAPVPIREPHTYVISAHNAILNQRMLMNVRVKVVGPCMTVWLSHHSALNSPYKVQNQSSQCAVRFTQKVYADNGKWVSSRFWQTLHAHSSCVPYAWDQAEFPPTELPSGTHAFQRPHLVTLKLFCKEQVFQCDVDLEAARVGYRKCIKLDGTQPDLLIHTRVDPTSGAIVLIIADFVGGPEKNIFDTEEKKFLVGIMRDPEPPIGIDMHTTAQLTSGNKLASLKAVDRPDIALGMHAFSKLLGSDETIGALGVGEGYHGAIPRTISKLSFQMKGLRQLPLRPGSSVVYVVSFAKMSRKSMLFDSATSKQSMKEHDFLYNMYMVPHDADFDTILIDIYERSHNYGTELKATATVKRVHSLLAESNPAVVQVATFNPVVVPVHVYEKRDPIHMGVLTLEISTTTKVFQNVQHFPGTPSLDFELQTGRLVCGFIDKSPRDIVGETNPANGVYLDDVLKKNRFMNCNFLNTHLVYVESNSHEYTGVHVRNAEIYRVSPDDMEDRSGNAIVITNCEQDNEFIRAVILMRRQLVSSLDLLFGEGASQNEAALAAMENELVHQVDLVSFNMLAPWVKLDANLFMHFLRYIFQLKIFQRLSTKKKRRALQHRNLAAVFVKSVQLSPIRMNVSFATANPVKAVVMTGAAAAVRNCSTGLLSTLAASFGKRSAAPTDTSGEQFVDDDATTGAPSAVGSGQEDSTFAGVIGGIGGGNSGSNSDKKDNTRSVLQVDSSVRQFAIAASQRSREKVTAEVVTSLARHFNSKISKQSGRLKPLLGWLEFEKSIPQLEKELEFMFGSSVDGDDDDVIVEEDVVGHS